MRGRDRRRSVMLTICAARHRAVLRDASSTAARSGGPARGRKAEVTLRDAPRRGPCVASAQPREGERAHTQNTRVQHGRHLSWHGSRRVMHATAVPEGKGEGVRAKVRGKKIGGNTRACA